MIILLLVVLAVLGGGWWYLKKHRAQREQEGRAFAEEATRRIVLQQDAHFLGFHLSPRAQVLYPPSWRMRLLESIREPGPARPDFRVKGQVNFVSQFSEPTGRFVAEVATPTGPGFLELQISHPGVLWLIDAINWTWQPPPTPTPAATPSPTAPSSPTPAPAKGRRH